MNALIHLIARYLARSIERGSLRGAWMGALLGLAMGSAVTLAVGLQVPLEGMVLGSCIAGTILLMLIGLVVGARVVKSAPVLHPSEAVRLSNHNRALVPLVPIGLCGGFGWLGWMVWQHEPTNRDFALIVIVGAVVVACGLFVWLMAFSVWWIEFDRDEMTLGIPWRTRHYAVEEIQLAAMIDEDDPCSPPHLQVQINDGAKVINLPTTKQKLVEISALLGIVWDQLGPDTDRSRF